jgi:hypothetical protein
MVIDAHEPPLETGHRHERLSQRLRLHRLGFKSTITLYSGIAQVKGPHIPRIKWDEFGQPNSSPKIERPMSEASRPEIGLDRNYSIG